ncbi:hypothetical protein J2X48_005339, partial [Bosea sp. BE271]|uniref:hypothetical protein n=1 Tax=Bosea TaxID=85413 RepID=UPI002858AB27
PAAKSRRSTQPTAVIEGRKLQPPAVQQLVSDQLEGQLNQALRQIMVGCMAGRGYSMTVVTIGS